MDTTSDSFFLNALCDSAPEVTNNDSADCHETRNVEEN